MPVPIVALVSSAVCWKTPSPRLTTESGTATVVIRVFQNASEPMDNNPELSVAVVSAVTLLKALSPIDVKVAGATNVVTAVSLKAEAPMLSSTDGKLMFASDVAPRNASSPIDVTPSGITTVVTPMSSKAPTPIAVTFAPSSGTDAGMVRVVVKHPSLVKPMTVAVAPEIS